MGVVEPFLLSAVTGTEKGSPGSGGGNWPSPVNNFTGAFQAKENCHHGKYVSQAQHNLTLSGLLRIALSYKQGS